MGYDMYWVDGPDEAEKAAVMQAREVYDHACAALKALGNERATAVYWRAREAMDDTYSAMRKVQKSYFSTNFSGMSVLTDTMDSLGMMFDDEKYPAWPDAEQYGITYDQIDMVESPDNYPADEYAEEYAELTPQVVEQARTYLEAKETILAWHAKADTPGIPHHKFSTNDGWHVLPVECEAVIRIWQVRCKEFGGEAELLAAVAERIGGKDAAGWWMRWLEFVEGAAQRGGFRVH